MQPRNENFFPGTQANGPTPLRPGRPDRGPAAPPHRPDPRPVRRLHRPASTPSNAAGTPPSPLMTEVHSIRHVRTPYPQRPVTLGDKGSAASGLSSPTSGTKD